MSEKQIIKYTPDNCVATACRQRLASKSREWVPNCLYCCNDVNEIKRRKALPLVKGPDGLRRKYLGIKKNEESGMRNEE